MFYRPRRILFEYHRRTPRAARPLHGSLEYLAIRPPNDLDSQLEGSGGGRPAPPRQ